MDRAKASKRSSSGTNPGKVDIIFLGWSWLDLIDYLIIFGTFKNFESTPNFYVLS